jgi:hypothetical protein
MRTSGSEGGPGKRTAATPTPRPGSTPPRGAEVRVSELPLDHDERNALVRHLDRVGVP